MAIQGISVEIGADVSGLNRGLMSAQTALTGFASAAGRIAKSLGVLGLSGAAAGFLAVAAGVRRVVNEADDMGKAAQKMGIMVEELGRLKYAADLSGVSFEGVQTSVNRLNRAIADFGAGKSSEAVDALTTLGITVRDTDGNMKSASQVISEISDKFEGYADGANKSAIAMAILGRSGAEMVPLLNQGSKALEDSKKEAEEFGAVMSGGLARSSEEFNDNLARIGTAVKGVFVQIAEKLVPKLADLSKEFVQLAKDMDFEKTAGEFTEKVLKEIPFYAAYASGWIQTLGTSLSGLGEATGAFVTGEWSKIPTILQSTIDQMDAIQKKVLDSLSRIRQESMALLPGAASILASGAFTGGTMTIEKKPDAPNFGGAKPTETSSGEKTTDPLEAQREQIAQRLQLIKDGFLSEQELLIQKYEADRNIVDVHYQTALEQFAGNKEMERQLGEEHYAIMEQLEADHQGKLAAIRNAGLNSALTGTAQVFNSLGRLVQSGGKKNVKLAKAFGIAEALISTFVAANKAMAFASTAGPGAAFAAYAAVAAKGLAAVASIRSVGDSGGGSAGSAGGGGGGGSFSVGQDNPGATGAAGNSVYISLQGQSFGRDQVRDLLEQISSYQKDGGQVVFA